MVADNIKFYDCKNIKIEGVGFTNSAIWCVNLFNCFDVDIDGINVFGQWRYNTDGIDIVNSQRVTIKNSFVHSFDDSITIKGIDKYVQTSNVDILIENCVLWCDWGRTCEIGLETMCSEYKNITFRDCDLLRAGSVACDIQNGDCAQVHNIVFENIRVELEGFYTASVYQASDEQKYDAKDSHEVAAIISVANKRFREMNMYSHFGFAEMHDFIGTHLIRAKTSINGAYTIKDGTKCIASSAFYGCDNLKSITMPESVTTMGSSVFYECKNLTSITMPESVTTMGSMVFWKCNKLKNVVLSSNLTSIESWTFYQCNNLLNIIIPDSVTLIGSSAFAYCNKLKTVQMGKGVNTIGGKAFYECNSLTSIEIPNSVETIGDEVFWNCYNLERINIGSGVTSISREAFYNCIALKSVYIIDIAAWCNITFSHTSANPLGWAENFYLNNELITQLVIPETVTMINAYAFLYCPTITSVIIPSSVKFIDHEAFYCSNLTSVYYEGTTEDWKDVQVAYMNQPFVNATR